MTIKARNASVAIIGAGDYIGAAIAKRFAREGFLVKVGRRGGDKLQPLVDEIEAAGGRVAARGLDARIPDDVTAFLAEAEAAAPLEGVIFNIGANVNFPILDTTDRVFRKVWEMACFSGFVTGREAARIMVPRGRGKIFFTGATAGLRGGSGYAAFAAAKFGLRAVAQSMARELWPQKIHVAHLIIDAGVDTAFVRDIIAKREGREALDNLDPDRLMPPDAIADAYWNLFNQPQAAWTFEQEIRPYGEIW
ncbi:SDR family NAD(P)-dependent oxidoreductase [Sphingopyxis chilensis]|uniref:SDR family NAD(P)-dependent oxidoreductase n=1 Tax=Sphingopyxis chilensis TaxID=180400 RepID=UPI002DDCB9FF|nr:SDR family NAD(P)-dependent oxidoreductase [Sphingopyxis chilensis]